MAYVGTPRLLGSDIETLASILQGEAGGEGLQGMQAVANVIQNRANQNFSGYGKSLLEQALAKNQFQGQSSKVGPEAKAVAAQLASGGVPDVTGGALYYANPGASTASWARRLNDQNALKIGNHYFTNNAKGEPFAGNPYAGLPDGPKGQESYPGLGGAPTGLASATSPQGGILAGGTPQFVADYWKSLPDEGTESPLQKMLAKFAKTPEEPAIRFGQMGDVRQGGDGLLKQLNSPTFADMFLKKRLG